MKILDLNLISFRGYSKAQFSFSPSVNVILGKNGSGKTNLIESIFLLSTGKSFRAERNDEMIQFDKEIARIKSEINQSGNEQLTLEIVLTEGEVAGIKTQKKKGQRMGQLFPSVPPKTHFPED